MSITNNTEVTSMLTRDNVLRLTDSEIQDICVEHNVSKQSRDLIASRGYNGEFLTLHTHLDLMNLEFPIEDAKAISRAFHITKTLGALQGIWRVGSYAVSVVGNVCKFADGQEIRITERKDFLQIRINLEVFRMEYSSRRFEWKSKTRVVEWTPINLTRGRGNTYQSIVSSVDSLSPKHLKVEVSKLNADGRLSASEYEEESYEEVDLYGYTPEGKEQFKGGFDARPPAPMKPLPLRPLHLPLRPPPIPISKKNTAVRLIPSSNSGLNPSDLGIEIDENSLVIPTLQAQRFYQSSKSTVDMDEYKVEMIKYDSPIVELYEDPTVKHRTAKASTFGDLPDLPDSPEVEPLESSFFGGDSDYSIEYELYGAPPAADNAPRKSTIWQRKRCQIKMAGEWFAATMRCESQLDGAFFYGVTISESDKARKHDIVGLEMTVPEDRVRSLNELEQKSATRMKSLSSVEETAWKWMMNDELEAMTMYVKLNGNLNIQQKGRTMLMEYLNRSGSNLEMVKLLVKGGADLSLISDNGWTCLHYAACHQDSRFLDYLLKHCPVDLLSRQTSSTTRTAPAGLTAENLAKLKGNVGAVQTFAKRQIPKVPSLRANNHSTESGSSNLSSSIKALLLPGDVRYVLIITFQTHLQLDLPFECAELICAFAMKNVQFESEQLQTNQLIHAVKLETGRYVSKIEARNALSRVNWNFDRAFTKMRTRMRIRIALESGK